MNSFRISWVAACVALGMPGVASAQFETWQQRASREQNERMWDQAREKLREQIEAFNVEIDAARKDFWAKYPDKPGANEARDKFFDLLDDKDKFYLQSELSNRMSTGGDVGDSLDGGIRATAKPEFDDLVEACRTTIGMGRDIMQYMQSIQRSIAAHPAQYAVYMHERNWWEFDQMHRIPWQWDKPEVYAVYLYYRYFHLSREDAEANNAKLIELLGKDAVIAAARKVMDAPKTDKGNLVVTVPRPMKRGPGGSELEDYSVPQPANPIGAYPDVLRVFLDLATKDDDRRYLLRLMTQEHRVDSTKIDRVHGWELAGADYTRLVAAFGEKEVLEAARKVRTATKRMVGGTVMDTAAIGAVRNDPFYAFEDILAGKNPRGYLRSAIAFNQALNTPAAIDAAYQKLVAGQEEMYLTAAGRRVANKPNVIYPHEIRSIKDLLGAGPEPEKVAEEMTDYPEYAAWKKFPAGAKVTYYQRRWMASAPRPGRFVSDDPTRIVPWPTEYIHSYLLKSIDDKQAALWFTETNANKYWQLGEPRDREIAYPAQILKSVAVRNEAQRRATNPDDAPFPDSTWAWGAHRTDDPVESGEEIVEVKGQRIATKWRSAKYRCDDGPEETGVSLFVKIWTSDAVPTGLVRRVEEKTVLHTPRQVQPARYVIERFLESFDGFTLPPVTASGPVMTAYTPPPLPASATPPAQAAAPTPVFNPSMRQEPSPPKPAAKPAVAANPPPPTPKPVARPAPAPVAIDTSKMPPEVARQMELSQRYNASVTRASRDRSQLLQWQQQHSGDAIPSDVQAASDKMLTQLQAAALAMTSKDSAKFDQTLRDLDSSSAAIEKFLAR